MLDRRKLAAPLAAQAAAFVVVLVIGGFTDHTPPAKHGSANRATPTASASASASAAKAAPRKLTVTVAEQGTNGVSVAGSQVNVLNGALTSVASGVLDSALKYAVNVPAGQYQVCLSPPIGWASAARGTHTLGDWICAAADVTNGPAVVRFRLAAQFAQGGQ